MTEYANFNDVMDSFEEKRKVELKQLEQHGTFIARLRAVVEEIEDDVDDYSKERPQFYEGFNQGLHKCIDKLRLAFPELSEEENDD